MFRVQLIIPDVVSIWNFGVSLIGQGLSSLDSRFRGNDKGRAGMMNNKGRKRRVYEARMVKTGMAKREWK